MLGILHTVVAQTVQMEEPSMHNERDRLLKPTEAADYLGLTLATIYTKASRRQLPTVKVGRSLRFRRADLEKIVRAGLRPALRPLHDAVDGDGDEQ
jgi:excisionase family DNA binding protein